jgi:hypothetical protein
MLTNFFLLLLYYLENISFQGKLVLKVELKQFYSQSMYKKRVVLFRKIYVQGTEFGGTQRLP